MKKLLLMSSLAGFMTATMASAQVVTTGTISVVVQDSSGGRLPGVAVTASADDVATRRTAVSNSEGEALLLNLAPSAQYVVVAELTGFRTLKNDRILVRSGQTATLHITLSLSSMADQVTVIAETPLVEPERRLEIRELREVPWFGSLANHAVMALAAVVGTPMRSSVMAGANSACWPSPWTITA